MSTALVQDYASDITAVEPAQDDSMSTIIADTGP